MISALIVKMKTNVGLGRIQIDKRHTCEQLCKQDVIKNVETY